MNDHPEKRSNVNGWMVATLVVGTFLLSIVVAVLSGGRGAIRDTFGPAVSGLVTVVLALLVWAIGLGLYFLPSIIAAKRQHHQVAPIVIVNFFLGWTVLGWVASLAWSVSPVKK